VHDLYFNFSFVGFYANDAAKKYSVSIGSEGRGMELGVVRSAKEARKKHKVYIV